MQGMPLKSIVPEERGWSTKWEVVIYVEYRECE